ncbi:MAG: alpha/beta hydrolase [Legionella sp.]|uniref:alpha/beta fold hydrolase n=1 Tax=Legionella sp. TaxID=459 RepID=UPI00283AC0A9|nr:alpha/beta hydrolase [Legionella sp.]
MNEYSYYNSALKINYAEGPNHGAPVLLLHGATHRWQSFTPITADLCAYFHVYAMDFRGHGKSQKRAARYALEDHLDDTQSFIEGVTKEPTVLIGHSLGAMVGCMLAAAQPQLVKALILIDPPLNLTYLRQLTMGFKDQINLLIQGLRLSNLGLPIDHFIPDHVRHCDPDMLSEMIHQFDETFKDYNINELFKQIICPTLLLYGSAALGSLTTANEVGRLLTIKPDLVPMQIENAGHLPICEDKETTLNAIMQFMEDENITSFKVKEKT